MLHAIAVLGSELFGFVALLFDAGQLRLERFDGGAGFVLGLRLPLHLRGHRAGLGIGSELGDQFLVALFFPGLGGFFFLLHILAQEGFQLPQAGVRVRLPAAKGLLGLGLGFGAGGVELGLPLLVALAQFRLEEFFLLLRLESQARFGGVNTRLGLAFPIFLAQAQIGGPLGLQFGFPGLGLEGQVLFALLEFCLEGEFLLLQFLLQAGVGLTPSGFELAFEFRLTAAQLLVGLLLRVLKANLGLGLQLFFALFESELRGVFTLLDFLAPARVHLAGALLDLALDLGLAEAGVLLDHALFLSEAGLKCQGQFLLALFQAMLGVLVVLAQRLFKFQLLPFETVFLLARNLLDLTGGVFLGL